MTIEKNIALFPLTTFGIGGPARYFALVQNIQEMREALAFANARAMKIFVLGGGSNVLIDDKGFDGLVLKIELKGVETVKEDGHMLIVAAAGESWDELVGRAVKENLWGIENLSGIPGSVGGAVVQNIGAYGSALSQTLEWVEVLDRESDSVKTLTKEACKFGYRDSIFKREPGRYVLLHAAFSLDSAPRPDLSYKDLALYFEGRVPSLGEIREAVIQIRKKKFPDLNFEGTAGSFFKNPVLSGEEAKKLALKYPGMPLFALPESPNIKIPLGWILDYRHGVLDLRDVRVGGARMFEKQFLVIATEKNTTAADVKELAKIVQEKILVACGISVEPEVHIVAR
ncbi:MAG: UDP-N-acetylmuramate dehydrogenase [Parcubacteria group bacterium Gr01-1014_56]|nr:MAG: UDP-N-acetylmuramate dehydrogenase [Parcubacteria group bacterium Gr01-1014_56]